MKSALFISLIVLSAVPCLAQSLFSDDPPTDISTDYAFVQSLFPHPAGSDNERVLILFIEERLKDLNVSFQTRDFSQAQTGHSFSRIIEAVIPGQTDEILMIAVPLNHRLDATKEEDGAFGIALLLSLIAHFLDDPPPLTLQFVFLGGEYSPDENQFLGTSYYLASSYPVERQAVLYLLLERFPARLRIMSGGRGIVSPLWLLNALMDSLQASGLPWFIQENRQQIFRTGLVTAATPVAAYLKEGYPAIGIASADPTGESFTGDRAVAFQNAIIRLVESTKDGLPATWDTHYILLPLPNRPVAVPETVYVVVLIALGVMLITFAALRMKMTRKYLTTVRKNFWNIPFFFAASFLLFAAASYVLDGLLAISNIPSLWTTLPLVFFALKVSLFLCLSALLYRLGYRLPFSKNGSFYTAAALFFILLCIVVFAFLNLSFIYYFLWSLLCIFLFSLFRLKRLKVLFFLLSPVAIIAILLNLFLIPELKFCDIVLFNLSLIHI